MKTVPNLFWYITSWESEIKDSSRVWFEYVNKKQKLTENGEKLTIEDIEELWDFGIPWISTLFQKDWLTLAYDWGWRLR